MCTYTRPACEISAKRRGEERRGGEIGTVEKWSSGVRAKRPRSVCVCTHAYIRTVKRETLAKSTGSRGSIDGL